MADQSPLDELLESQLAINEDQLPLEHREQPLRYGRLGRLAARATAALGKAELALRLYEAKADLHLRKTGLPDGIKSTETAFQSAIRASPAYEKLKLGVIEAQEQADLYNNLLKAMEIRGWSLKHLERTAGQSYGPESDELLAQQAARRHR